MDAGYYQQSTSTPTYVATLQKKKRKRGKLSDEEKRQRQQETKRRKQEKREIESRLKRETKQQKQEALEEKRQEERKDQFMIKLNEALGPTDERIRLAKESQNQREKMRREWNTTQPIRRERQIFETLSTLSDMIMRNDVTGRNIEEFGDAKIALQVYNEAYALEMGSTDNDSECVSTSFLTSIFEHEIRQAGLNQAETTVYRQMAQDRWIRYMDQNILPYLLQPSLILKKTADGDDKKLKDIMTFARYQWGILDDHRITCKQTTPQEGANMIGFLINRNGCNCTCIVALLLLTADCLGLFPDLIRGELVGSDLSVITASGYVIEGNTQSEDFFVARSIATPEQFIKLLLE